MQNIDSVVVEVKPKNSKKAKKIETQQILPKESSAEPDSALLKSKSKTPDSEEDVADPNMSFISKSGTVAQKRIQDKKAHMCLDIKRNLLPEDVPLEIFGEDFPSRLLNWLDFMTKQ